MIDQTRRLAQKSIADKIDFDINDAIREVLAFVGAGIRDQRIIIRMSLAAGLPPVSGVRVQIQQVLLNLALNGIEAMEHVADDIRELTITSERVEGNGVLVVVRDMGAGFAAQDSRDSSRPFTRQSPAAWVWGCRSVSRLLPTTVGACGPLRTRNGERRSSSSCRRASRMRTE